MRARQQNKNSLRVYWFEICGFTVQAFIRSVIISEGHLTGAAEEAGTNKKKAHCLALTLAPTHAVGPSGVLDCAEELLFVHLVAALLPRFSKALQNGANLLARRDAHLPQVVPTNGESWDGPARHLGKKLLLALVLEQLTHFSLNVHLPALQTRT